MWHRNRWGFYTSPSKKVSEFLMNSLKEYNCFEGSGKTNNVFQAKKSKAFSDNPKKKKS